MDRSIGTTQQSVVGLGIGGLNTSAVTLVFFTLCCDIG